MGDIKTYESKHGTVRLHGVELLARERIEPALARYASRIKFGKEKKNGKGKDAA